MSSLIPQSFIDDLLDRIDIIEVIDHRVKLKKSGKNYSACCPFHDEKTPSFTVTQEKQFYHCFGCGASGNAVGFLMEYERFSFPESVEQLARLAGVEVPREARSEASQQREKAKKSIYSLLEKTSDYYCAQLRQHPTRQSPVNYLRERGLSGEIARDFGIGYAPPGWDNLLQELGQNNENKHLLIEGGMLINREEDKKLYDRFRQRIMFPIRDIRGRIIGFGGRVLGDDKPKYLNSPETPVFHKGRELYGLYEARQAYSQLPRLLVVEGYMDVVALAQYGIRYGVATLGTACGEDHLNRAFKYTTEVVFCFDGDNAGRKAAKRALENTLPSMEDGRQVKFLFLPDGEDPDTLIRQIGSEKFTLMVETAVPLEDFLFDSLAEGIDIQSMEGRARLSKLAAPLLHKLPKSVYRELMFDNLASRTGLNRDILMELVELPPEATPSPNTFSPSAKPQHTQHPADTHAARPNTHSATEFNAAPATNSADDHNPAHHDSEYYTDDATPPELADAPPADYGEYFVDNEPSYADIGTEHSQTQSNSQKYRISPAQKIITLLLSQPELAQEVERDIPWGKQNDEDLTLFGNLVEVLHQRPHYKLSHLIGYWRASHSEKEAQRLTDIVGIDLVQATKAISQARNNKPAQAEYNNKPAFLDTLKQLQKQIGSKKTQSLEKLKNTPFTELSKEERQLLVNEALAGKIPKSD